MPPILVSSIGMALLLVVFALNLLRLLSEHSVVLLLMNVVGVSPAA